MSCEVERSIAVSGINSVEEPVSAFSRPSKALESVSESPLITVSVKRAEAAFTFCAIWKLTSFAAPPRSAITRSIWNAPPKILRSTEWRSFAASCGVYSLFSSRNSAVGWVMTRV